MMSVCSIQNLEVCKRIIEVDQVADISHINQMDNRPSLSNRSNSKGMVTFGPEIVLGNCVLLECSQLTGIQQDHNLNYCLQI